MATTGHLVTMVGVLAFYIMLLDSHLERKITSYIVSLIPRLNKRVTYYLNKLINFKQFGDKYAVVPNAAVQRTIN